MVREKLLLVDEIMSDSTKILAIDTSCDDSSAAVVSGRNVLSNIVSSQHQIHKKYGGVFPTLAKQAHRENLAPTIAMALQQAKTSFSELAAIAVTVGPGLAPALEVGINNVQEIAKKYNKKIIAVNHIEAHALSPIAVSAKQKVQVLEKFPILAVVISGGHSEFILVEKIGQYQKIGQTIDDAAGECLDKVGRLLNLGYPAGPLIEKFAKKGVPNRFTFPKAMTSRADFDLSFSGLKTAARNLIAQLDEAGELDQQTTCDLALAIQSAVFEQISYKLERILFSPDPSNKIYPSRDYLRHLSDQKDLHNPIKEIWLGGGVAANIALRQAIRKLLNKYQKTTGQKIEIKVPYSKRLCGDNAAMIGLVASFKLQRGEFAKTKDLDRQPNLKI